MYPRISDIFPDLFGFSLPFPIYSYGFMAAVAALVGAWLAGAVGLALTSKRRAEAPVEEQATREAASAPA